MSNINTNGIDATYPLPGVNNSTQGFRDNFSSIKQNLNITSAEITDLQSKAIVKSSLDGFSLNNNMANTLISNALVRNFRHTTFNLGSNLSGTITIDVSKGDVQYGTITANTIINFGGWMPSGTLGSVQLNLNIANANAVITLPVSSTDASAKVVSGMLKSVLILGLLLLL